jgi:hypothetical protein
MRLRKADIRQRVNGNLEFRFMSTGLTSYAGLELLRRYFRSLELVRQLRVPYARARKGLQKVRGTTFPLRGPHL